MFPEGYASRSVEGPDGRWWIGDAGLERLVGFTGSWQQETVCETPGFHPHFVAASSSSLFVASWSGSRILEYGLVGGAIPDLPTAEYVLDPGDGDTTGIAVIPGTPPTLAALAGDANTVVLFTSADSVPFSGFPIEEENGTGNGGAASSSSSSQFSSSSSSSSSSSLRCRIHLEPTPPIYMNEAGDTFETVFWRQRQHGVSEKPLKIKAVTYPKKGKYKWEASSNSNKLMLKKADKRTVEAYGRAGGTCVVTCKFDPDDPDYAPCERKEEVTIHLANRFPYSAPDCELTIVRDDKSRWEIKKVFPHQAASQARDLETRFWWHEELASSYNPLNRPYPPRPGDTSPRGVLLDKAAQTLQYGWRDSFCKQFGWPADGRTEVYDTRELMRVEQQCWLSGKKTSPDWRFIVRKRDVDKVALP